MDLLFIKGLPQGGNLDTKLYYLYENQVNLVFYVVIPYNLPINHSFYKIWKKMLQKPTNKLSKMINSLKTLVDVTWRYYSGCENNCNKFNTTLKSSFSRYNAAVIREVL